MRLLRRKKGNDLSAWSNIILHGYPQPVIKRREKPVLELKKRTRVEEITTKAHTRRFPARIFCMKIVKETPECLIGIECSTLGKEFHHPQNEKVLLEKVVDKRGIKYRRNPLHREDRDPLVLCRKHNVGMNCSFCMTVIEVKKQLCCNKCHNPFTWKKHDEDFCPIKT